MKLRGAQRRPTMKEREKLRVARVERKRPRMRREKDLMRWYCCGWGVRVCDRVADRRRGRMRFARMLV